MATSLATKTIIVEITSREEFHDLLKQNPGLIIIKLGAEWCGPCKRIKQQVYSFFSSSPPQVVCADIDIDKIYPMPDGKTTFDLYTYLKNKRLTNGVPAILCYKQGNTSFIPDDMLTGGDTEALNAFFKRCGMVHLPDVLGKQLAAAQQRIKK